jgi:hypothetical protein
VKIAVFIREICKEEAKTMRNEKLKSEFIRYTASDGGFFFKTRGPPPPPIVVYRCESGYFIKRLHEIQHAHMVF